VTREQSLQEKDSGLPDSHILCSRINFYFAVQIFEKSTLQSYCIANLLASQLSANFVRSDTASDAGAKYMGGRIRASRPLYTSLPCDLLCRCTKSSKVSPTVILRSKISSELTFGNFFHSDTASHAGARDMRGRVGLLYTSFPCDSLFRCAKFSKLDPTVVLHRKFSSKPTFCVFFAQRNSM